MYLYNICFLYLSSLFIKFPANDAFESFSITSQLEHFQTHSSTSKIKFLLY